jgi:methylmalonyl-CoA mutase
LRRLWQRVEENCGLVPEPAFVAAETAWRTMTRNDPQTNILRATIATFAAGIGGADAITVLPFTAALGLCDAFARRIARNSQLVLVYEASLARVSDPAAGSGWLVDLADKLSHAAWALFQEIERAGGAPAAIEQGLIQARIMEARATLRRDVATRRLTLVGANDFAQLGEAKITGLDAAPVPLPPRATAIAVAGLAQMRLAEPFEALRDASDRMLATSGARPRIFLAGLGAAADFTARMIFAKNFFEAGGIEALTHTGFADRGALIAAFTASGTRLACLCAADRDYESDAAATAPALKTAGAALVFLAGQPGAHEGRYRQAGIDTFIQAGCDMLAILEAAWRVPDHQTPVTSPFI